MIYDCFPFYNELDVLEMRLSTLGNLVDKFVLAEATRTHSNLPKPLHFHENRGRFAAYLDKIVHLVVDDYPPFKNSWTIENHQRNCISRALTSCADSDIIILSDVDEIPRPSALTGVLEYPGVTCLLQDLYFYFANYLDTRHLVWLGGSKVLRYEVIRHGMLDEDFVVYNEDTFPRYLNRGATMTKVRLYTDCWYVPHGGWHFSYLGGINAIRNKLRAFAHQEYNTEEMTDPVRLNRLIESGDDIFGRPDHKFVAVPIDEDFPQFLRDNLTKFEHLIRTHNLVDMPRSIRRSGHVKESLKGYVKKLGGRTLRRVLRDAEKGSDA